MKRIVVAASTDKDFAYRRAERILKLSKELLDAMEDTPHGFLEIMILGAYMRNL